MEGEPRVHSSHWGAFTAAPSSTGVTVTPHPLDPDPSAILGNLPAAPRNRARIAQPMIRRGWLRDGPGPSEARGSDPFVPVSWDRATALLGAELGRVHDEHGPAAIYGGSYGWASAGRFHHAQSQVHRFLNTFGGYVRSVNSYSAGASTVILPHVAASVSSVSEDWVTWPAVVERTELIVAFGGMARKNGSVGGGGVTRHVVPGTLLQAHARGCAFVLVSPLRDDLVPELEAAWVPLRPMTDVPLMLGLAHTLWTEGRCDEDFLRRCTVGFDRFARYLSGEVDGVVKSADWAATVTGIPAAEIVGLARRMAGRRTLISVSHSLQRAEHGEQPVWMGLVLAAMLGQIGVDGGGFAYSLGALANTGKPTVAAAVPALPQGHNAVRDFIPVARVSDMLLHPGEPFDYDGRERRYPSIHLVYWAGGNPFHHHQDLARLRRAFARPDTVVVHDSVWTATARHADVVLPATISMERDDIGGTHNDDHLIAMHRVVEPYAQARDDYAIFSDLAEALGARESFTENRSVDQWLRLLYAQLEERLRRLDVVPPSFDEFWELGVLPLPRREDPGRLVRQFREDPEGHPLKTPSGRIEIFSATIDGFGYDDCPGHPAWIEPVEWLGSAAARRYPLQLVANQPAVRLHSQLDFGATSQASKVGGHEPIRLHPSDARARGIAGGDVVRVFNDRGACLAGAVLSDALLPGVAQLSTGAWYTPLDPANPRSLCVHGNPNVLTRDVGTSRLAQGSTGQLTLVEIERWDGPVPALDPYAPPPTAPD